MTLHDAANDRWQPQHGQRHARLSDGYIPTGILETLDIGGDTSAAVGINNAGQLAVYTTTGGAIEGFRFTDTASVRNRSVVSVADTYAVRHLRVRQGRGQLMDAGRLFCERPRGHVRQRRSSASEI